MKETFAKIIVFLLNKLFKTKIDSTTFHFLRHTQISSTDLNRFIEFYNNKKDDLENLYGFYHEFHNPTSSRKKPLLVEKGSLASYLNLILDVKNL